MRTVILENIYKNYGEITACSGIDLSIKEGEFFTFLGPSGCGKSTTLRLIAGFISPDKGRISIGTQDMARVPAEKRKVGMVFQNYALFPFMTVFDNVAYSLQVKKYSARVIEEKVHTYLEMVDLKDYGHRQVSDLSGGEQQRVALARSLVMEPNVLLLDEPLSNLDAKLRLTMRSEIRNIVKRLGITTIFVTHDQVEALSISDRIAVFNQGTCVQVGRPEEIYNNPSNAFVANFVGDINIWSFDSVDEETCRVESLDFKIKAQANKQYLSVRPQDIVLSEKRPEGDNVFSGCIKKHQLVGMSNAYEIAVDGLVLKVTTLNTYTQRNVFTIGQRVFVSIPSETIRLLSD